MYMILPAYVHMYALQVNLGFIPDRNMLYVSEEGEMTF